MKVLSILTGDGALVALLVAACLGAGAAVSYNATSTHYKLVISKMEHATAKREVFIATSALKSQQARIDKIQGALSVAQEQASTAQRDADTAAAATRKLQAQLAAYKGRFTCTSTTGQGEPDSDPIGVLADLLSRMGEAGGRISRYADEVKIAGAACEAAWPTNANSESKP